MGPKGKKQQIYLMMHTRRKICVPVKKIAAVLSELLECELMPDRDSRTFVGQERITVLFVEAAAYNVLYGVRKATRQGEAYREIILRYSGCRMELFMLVFPMEWDPD